VLRAIAPSLAFNGLDPAKVKLLGTDCGTMPPSPGNRHWMAAGSPRPSPMPMGAFTEKYKNVYGAAPPPIGVAGV